MQVQGEGTQAEIPVEVVAPTLEQAKDGPKEVSDPIAEIEQKVKERREFKMDKRKASLMSKENEALKARIKEFESQLEEFEKSPLDFVTKRGKKLDDLVDASIDRPVEDPTASKLAKLEQELEAMKQEKIDRETRDADSQFKGSIKDKCKELGENAELVNHFEAWDHVYDAMNEHYQLNLKEHKDQQLALDHLFPMERYIQETEKLLEEQYSKAKGSPKLARMFGVSSVEKKPTSTTLNNRVASAPSVTKDPSDMSKEERDAYSSTILRAARQRSSY